MQFAGSSPEKLNTVIAVNINKKYYILMLLYIFYRLLQRNRIRKKINLSELDVL